MSLSLKSLSTVLAVGSNVAGFVVVDVGAKQVFLVAVIVVIMHNKQFSKT
jgi:hypothetical protein